jgi:hypothetical protein
MEGEMSKTGDFCGQQSILSALNKFVQAVNVMDDTVMIPCRLRDMEISKTAPPEMNVENNNRAVLPTVSAGTDLHSCYAMLNAIKAELISGNDGSETDTDPDSEQTGAKNSDSETGDSDAHTRKIASKFSHHLHGLFSLLHQLTETAKYLTNRYETEVDQNSRGSISSFAI